MTELVEIVKQAQGGDREAFEELMRLNRRKVFGRLHRLIGAKDDIEDVAQDVFVRLYDSLDKLREPQCFEVWLYRLVEHAAYDYLRRVRRRRDCRISDLSEEQEQTIDAQPGMDAHLTHQRHEAARDLVTRLLDRLAPADRTLLVLKEIEGLSLKELEQIYEVNTNALKVRLFRSRKRALQALAQLQGTDESTAVRELALAFQC